jgi:hydrogenase-4 component B
VVYKGGALSMIHTDDFILPLSILFPMATAVISYCVGRKSKTARNVFAAFSCALELLLLSLILKKVIHRETMYFSIPQILSGLNFEADGFRALYICITGFMWLCTTVFSSEYLSHYRSRNRYYFFTLLTLGATIGVFLSSDLLTTFIFFEIMSFTSYVMVIHDETPDAMRAGQTYLAVAVLGGMVMLMGIFLLYKLAGTLAISRLAFACSSIH